MGLDITWARKAQKTELTYDEFEEQWTSDSPLVPVWLNSDFPGREDNLVEGVYQVQEQGSFRAGSYSGYNRWREVLCKVAIGATTDEVWAKPGYYEDSPMFPLVQFSDCEGVLGPETCARLAAGMRAITDPRQQAELDYGQGLYSTWLEALEKAADGGFLMFH